MSTAAPIAPGAHIRVRDAYWRVLQVNRTSTGKQSWKVVGVSEIVRDQEAIFLEEYEPSVEVVDPAETKVIADRSPGHRDSLLYIESLLRDVPATGEGLHIGHEGAMDLMDFQLEPARQALAQPRQRILIADAVGLGKTLEAGILMSELIRRGRGKRILVVTVKSMLTQFQKELWCRFSIPLVRLDSQGLHKIRQHIPTNHNPFHHYDRAIISIDTLKQNNAFRTHVEQAWWDIIVIDEAHNVAARGGGRSQRARIAEVLAERSDALILLSATPHDGKARSFASLMNMLDPTAIANPDEYTRDEIEGLFVRRFKGDVAHEMGDAIPERDMARAHATASDTEEAAYESLAALSFTRIDKRSHGGMLFKWSLIKALFSSPAACLQTIDARLKRLHSREDWAEYQADIDSLGQLRDAVEDIDAPSFSKYQKLLELIRLKKSGLGWKAGKKDDRLVIFSERIETLKFLQAQLSEDLGLKEQQVALLHGGLSDIEQQHIVEEFGKSSAKVRLLLASDVASEGLNLHYLCHKLVHFDVPWSLMVFQQRNGRIDRYGQERTPIIRYLLTNSANEEIAGDRRVLELLIERDEQAVKNISKDGDPSALGGAYDVDAQEQFTAQLMADGLDESALNERLNPKKTLSPLELLLGGGLPKTDGPKTPEPPFSLFRTEFDYLRTSLDRLAVLEGIERVVREDEQIIEVSLPPDNAESRRLRAPGLDLRRRFRKLPAEVLPKDGVVVLSPDKAAMQKAMADARREESAWPVLHYLWPLNPVVEWCQAKGHAAFGRREAPVVTMMNGLEHDELVIVVSGLVPNRRAQPLVHSWFAVRFRAERHIATETFETFAASKKLGQTPLPNREVPCEVAQIEALIPEAVKRASAAIVAERDAFEQAINVKLEEQLQRLETLRGRQMSQLELDFGGAPSKQAAKGERKRRIDHVFDNYLRWVEDSMTSEPTPFLQVIAAFRAEAFAAGGAA